MAVKTLIFAQRFSLGKIPPLTKSAIFPKYPEGYYVNKKWISTIRPSCGKLLWITLWRMWKTPSYQQVSCWFGKPPQPVEIVYRYLYMRIRSMQLQKLRHQKRCSGFLQKSFTKFTIRKNCVSYFVTPFLISLKICEKPTKETHGIFFLFRGILSTVPPKTMRQSLLLWRFLCREKWRSAA